MTIMADIIIIPLIITIPTTGTHTPQSIDSQWSWFSDTATPCRVASIMAIPVRRMVATVARRIVDTAVAMARLMVEVPTAADRASGSTTRGRFSGTDYRGSVVSIATQSLSPWTVRG